jgi:hypothetical protein
MKRRCESLYSALPLNRISPHLPGSLESFCIRFDILHPAAGFARAAVFLVPWAFWKTTFQRRDAENPNKLTWLTRVAKRIIGVIFDSFAGLC